ncbi:hypothetical protein D5086_009420 [Populus alba]|uniref:Uncharacterized protein n=1 Tax=Populus alba TaxID=43335 RepID=A0ACC4CKL5_POPAL
MKTISSKVVKKFITKPPSLLSSTASLTSIASFNVSNKAFPSSLLDDFTKFCYQRDLPRAMQALELMHTHCIRADCITYSELIKCCLARRAIQHGKRVGVLGFDAKRRSALIDVYSRWGELENALRVFDEMVTGDLVVWSSIIAGFAQNSDGDEALRLFKRMKRAGFLAQQTTLTSVLRACTGLALLELGRQVHVHVLKYDQDLILNNALLDMVHRNVDVAIHAAKQILRLDPQDAGTYEIKLALVVCIFLASREWGKERRRRPIEQLNCLIGFI